MNNELLNNFTALEDQELASIAGGDTSYNFFYKVGETVGKVWHSFLYDGPVTPNYIPVGPR